MVERAKVLNVNAGTEPDTDIGPVMTKQVMTRKDTFSMSKIGNSSRLIGDTLLYVSLTIITFSMWSWLLGYPVLLTF